MSRIAAGIEKPTYDRAENAAAQIGLIAGEERILSAASRLDPTEVRSLDAVHLAIALSAPKLGGMVSYNAWLVEAAKRASILAFVPAVKR